MLSDEAAPEPPTTSSCRNRSAAVVTGAVADAVQMRAGNEVAPNHRKRRGSASTMAWPSRDGRGGAYCARGITRGPPAGAAALTFLSIALRVRHRYVNRASEPGH